MRDSESFTFRLVPFHDYLTEAMLKQLDAADADDDAAEGDQAPKMSLWSRFLAFMANAKNEGTRAYAFEVHITCHSAYDGVTAHDTQPPVLFWRELQPAIGATTHRELYIYTKYTPHGSTQHEYLRYSVLRQQSCRVQSEWTSRMRLVTRTTISPSLALHNYS